MNVEIVYGTPARDSSCEIYTTPGTVYREVESISELEIPKRTIVVVFSEAGKKQLFLEPDNIRSMKVTA